MDAMLSRTAEKTAHANGNNVNELNIHESIVLFGMPAAHTYTEIARINWNGPPCCVRLQRAEHSPVDFIMHANIKVAGAFALADGGVVATSDGYPGHRLHFIRLKQIH